MAKDKRLENARAPMSDCVGEHTSVYVMLVFLRGTEVFDFLASSTSIRNFHARTMDNACSFLFSPFCGSKMKRVDKSDNEEERDSENLKKKRKRIKQLQSDSSDEEGKKMCKQPGM